MTSSCPFAGWSSKFVHRPENIGSSNGRQLQAFQDNLWAYFWQFSNWFKFFFLEMMLIQARTWNFVQVLCLFVRQFTIFLNSFLSMSFNVVGPRNRFCVKFFPPLYFFSCSSRNSLSEHFSVFINNDFVRLPFTLSASQIGQEMMLIHEDQHSSSISSIWEPHSLSFQPFWCHPHVPIRIILKWNEWVFHTGPRFRPFMSWKTYPKIWTFWLWNSGQSGSILHLDLGECWYSVGCLSITVK